MFGMRPRLPAIASVLVSFLACTLPLEDKAACDDSLECLDGRACVQGRCTDDACVLACDALCEGQRACGSVETCSQDCIPSQTDLAAVVRTECGPQYDLLADASCEEIGCFESCAKICARGVECALIDASSVCTVQCQYDPDPCIGPAASCADLDAAALACWARGELSGC